MQGFVQIPVVELKIYPVGHEMHVPFFFVKQFKHSNTFLITKKTTRISFAILIPAKHPE